MIVRKDDFKDKYIRINFDWKFHKGDIQGAEKREFDDSNWRTLDLPHDWSIEGPFDERWANGTGYLPAGMGWYRKVFSLTEDIGDKKLTIHFEGAYKNAEVWINDQYLGIRPYGYSSFHYDLTPHLKGAGEQQTVAVKLSHPDFADSRWYPGSGITRNVLLSLSDKAYIEPYGIYATTPLISESQAHIQLDAALVNEHASPIQATIRHTVRDGTGRAVAAQLQEVELGSAAKQTVSLTLPIENPILWSAEQPYLYKVETELYVGKALADREYTVIGIRDFRFDRDQGFFLNGQNIKMKGVCLHHDAGALGAAVPVKVWERRLRILKEAGVNAIRMSHNPPDPGLLDLCDSMGFLVMDEAFDEWELPKNKWMYGHNQGVPSLDGYAENFESWAVADLREMVLRDRNHPSIVFWSIGNEVDYPNDPYSHPVLEERYYPERPDANRLGAIAERLSAVVRELDPTRPVTAALASPLMSNETGYPAALDVVGYNYMEHRYVPDKTKYPERVIYGSENGRDHEAWQAVELHDFICAQFIWTGIDYLGEARGWPIRTATFGMLDLAGFAKPVYHFKRSIWSNAHMVRIGVLNRGQRQEDAYVNWHTEVEEQWNAPVGESVTVVCCSSCEEAELFVNGRSYGRKRPDQECDRTVRWDIPYEPGTVQAIGYSAGAARCTHELRSDSEPGKLNMAADTQTVIADRVDLAHIEVTVTDDAGHPVYGAANDISFEIAGPGRIIGIESGDPASHEDYKANRRRAYRGKLLVYVQSTDRPGMIRLTAAADGLKGAAIEIASKGIGW